MRTLTVFIYPKASDDWENQPPFIANPLGPTDTAYILPSSVDLSYTNCKAEHESIISASKPSNTITLLEKIREEKANSSTDTNGIGGFSAFNNLSLVVFSHRLIDIESLIGCRVELAQVLTSTTRAVLFTGVISQPSRTKDTVTYNVKSLVSTKSKYIPANTPVNQDGAMLAVEVKDNNAVIPNELPIDKFYLQDNSDENLYHFVENDFKQFGNRAVFNTATQTASRPIYHVMNDFIYFEDYAVLLVNSDEELFRGDEITDDNRNITLYVLSAGIDETGFYAYLKCSVPVADPIYIQDHFANQSYTRASDSKSLNLSNIFIESQSIMFPYLQYMVQGGSSASMALTHGDEGANRNVITNSLETVINSNFGTPKVDIQISYDDEDDLVALGQIQKLDHYKFGDTFLTGLSFTDTPRINHAEWFIFSSAYITQAILNLTKIYQDPSIEKNSAYTSVEKVGDKLVLTQEDIIGSNSNFNLMKFYYYPFTLELPDLQGSVRDGFTSVDLDSYSKPVGEDLLLSLARNAIGISNLTETRNLIGWDKPSRLYDGNIIATYPRQFLDTRVGHSNYDKIYTYGTYDNEYIFNIGGIDRYVHNFDPNLNSPVSLSEWREAELGLSVAKWGYTLETSVTLNSIEVVVPLECDINSNKLFAKIAPNLDFMPPLVYHLCMVGYEVSGIAFWKNVDDAHYFDSFIVSYTDGSYDVLKFIDLYPHIHYEGNYTSKHKLVTTEENEGLLLNGENQKMGVYGSDPFTLVEYPKSISTSQKNRTWAVRGDYAIKYDKDLHRVYVYSSFDLINSSNPVDVIRSLVLRYSDLQVDEDLFDLARPFRSNWKVNYLVTDETDVRETIGKISKEHGLITYETREGLIGITSLTPPKRADIAITLTEDDFALSRVGAKQLSYKYYSTDFLINSMSVEYEGGTLENKDLNQKGFTLASTWLDGSEQKAILNLETVTDKDTAFSCAEVKSLLQAAPTNEITIELIEDRVDLISQGTWVQINSSITDYDAVYLCLSFTGNKYTFFVFPSAVYDAIILQETFEGTSGVSKDYQESNVGSVDLLETFED